MPGVLWNFLRRWRQFSLQKVYCTYKKPFLLIRSEISLKHCIHKTTVHNLAANLCAFVCFRYDGDIISGADGPNQTLSLDFALEPLIEGKYKFAAVLGNHDQEGNLDRREVHVLIVLPGLLYVSIWTHAVESKEKCPSSPNPSPLLNSMRIRVENRLKTGVSITLTQTEEFEGSSVRSLFSG